MKINIKNIIKNIIKHEIWLIVWLVIWEIIRMVVFMNSQKFQYYSIFYLKRDFFLLAAIIILIGSIIQQFIKDNKNNC